MCVPRTYGERRRMGFDCVRSNGSVSRFPVTLNLPGMHNVLNALAGNRRGQ